MRLRTLVLSHVPSMLGYNLPPAICSGNSHLRRHAALIITFSGAFLDHKNSRGNLHQFFYNKH